jgi:hypothetical protein
MTAIDDLQRGWTLPANAAGALDLTTHALAQTNRRHFRRLDIERARHEFCAQLENAVVTREPPPWIFKRSDREKVLAWLILEDAQLCWPLYAGRGAQTGALVAGTCLSPTATPVGAEVRVRIEGVNVSGSEDRPQPSPDCAPRQSGGPWGASPGACRILPLAAGGRAASL